MPLSMKIQPIDTVSGSGPETVSKPVVKSRLRRLFRISTADPPPVATATAEVFEPSSLCLAKMVQNFIEESNEKQSPHVARCGRNRCNCFNGNGSDGSDVESDSVSVLDVCDYVKSLVTNVNVNEKKVLDDTTKIVADKNKSCKRKDEMRKIVSQGLVFLGYDASICKSKWDKSSSFPAGEYEYMDVIIGEERLIIDIDFRSEFEVARSTKTYKSILQTLPNIYVGESDRLSKIIGILSEAAKQSLKKKGMHIPPWRKANYVQAKWLSPPTRLIPPLTVLGSALSVNESNGPSPDKVGAVGKHEDEPKPYSNPNPSPTRFVSVFDMSESSGEEDVNQKSMAINSKKNSKSGLSP